MVKPKSVLYKLMRAALKCGSTLVDIDNTYKIITLQAKKGRRGNNAQQDKGQSNTSI
jgi:hypothetical protein